MSSTNKGVEVDALESSEDGREEAGDDPDANEEGDKAPKKEGGGENHGASKGVDVKWRCARTGGRDGLCAIGRVGVERSVVAKAQDRGQRKVVKEPRDERHELPDEEARLATTIACTEVGVAPVQWVVLLCNGLHARRGVTTYERHRKTERM